MMSAIQWIVFLAYLAAPSEQGESSLDTEELSRYAGTTAQERSGRQTIGSPYWQIGKLRQEMRQLRQEVSSMKSQLAAQNQMGHHHHHQQKQKIHEECSNYHTLSSPIRAISNSNSQTRWSDNLGYQVWSSFRTMPDWRGHARYRFTGPFTRMAVKGEVNSSSVQCGTRYPAYIADPKAHDMMEIGEMKEFVKVCYVQSSNAPSICAFSTVITITRCPGDYFVYRLPEAEHAHIAAPVYCGHK